MNENTLLFCKTRKVKSPVRAHETDAGIDFFLPNEFTPNDLNHSEDVTGTKLMLDDKLEKIIIPPHGSLLISSGIRMIVPDGHALIFTNKSGVAAKKHLVVGSCCVDSCYRGETYISLINTSDKPVSVSPGEKIVQGIIYEVGSHVPAEVDNIDNYSAPTERGAGGFGSTGNGLLMNNIEYIKKFRHDYGYAPDYFPKNSVKEVLRRLLKECELKMPTDTAAREVEGDAVFLLVSSNDEMAVEYGKKLGDLLMSHDTYTTEELLKTIHNAARALNKLI